MRVLLGIGAAGLVGAIAWRASSDQRRNNIRLRFKTAVAGLRGRPTMTHFQATPHGVCPLKAKGAVVHSCIFPGFGTTPAA